MRGGDIERENEKASGWGGGHVGGKDETVPGGQIGGEDEKAPEPQVGGGMKGFRRGYK